MNAGRVFSAAAAEWIDWAKLDAHVEQAVDSRWRIVGMERREHHMTRERRLDRDLRGLEISNLTDHDDVGVLAKRRSQRRREVQTDAVVHLHLIDAR